VCYDKAYALDPISVGLVSNIARLLVRTGNGDEKAWRLLTVVMMCDRKPE
jgi:hypothetical protein